MIALAISLAVRSLTYANFWFNCEVTIFNTGETILESIISRTEKETKIYWGWFVVFGSFWLMVLTYGARYSFGVFVKPMFAEYGWPMTMIQLGFSINLVTYACMCVISGWLLNRVPVKWLMMAGVISIISTTHVRPL